MPDNAGPGHNSAGRQPLQWQTPHLDKHHHRAPPEASEPDLDLVEAAFVEAFELANDPTSFLRLAHIPFVTERDGARLDLLRVEIENRVDVAAISPTLGGGHKTSPLPKSLISKRRQLRFVYLAGTESLTLSLNDLRTLPDLTPMR